MPNFPSTIVKRKKDATTGATYMQIATGGDHYGNPTDGPLSARERLAALDPSDWVGFHDRGGGAAPGYSARGDDRASGAVTYLDLSAGDTVLVVATGTAIAIPGNT